VGGGGGVSSSLEAKGSRNVLPQKRTWARCVERKKKRKGKPSARSHYGMGRPLRRHSRKKERDQTAKSTLAKRKKTIRRKGREIAMRFPAMKKGTPTEGFAVAYVKRETNEIHLSQHNKEMKVMGEGGKAFVG